MKNINASSPSTLLFFNSFFCTRAVSRRSTLFGYFLITFFSILWCIDYATRAFYHLIYVSFFWFSFLFVCTTLSHYVRAVTRTVGSGVTKFRCTGAFLFTQVVAKAREYL